MPDTQQIKTLFDPSRDIYRTIEKVITYGTSQEARLKAEIGEYIATDSINTELHDLLSKMQLAMEYGGEHEIGVWVSGFYGSGKSSFTKYLGLAFDDSVTIDGTPFIKRLQDRLTNPQTKALLGTVAATHSAAVVMLDLASEMLAGATMEDVSTVLYYKVLQWAGYSRNLKVAAFERKLQKDGRYDEFTAKILSDLDVPWSEVQNDPLVIDSLIPEIAHAMYPDLFKTASSFSTEAGDFVKFENERVREMIDIVREHSGKEHILFIVDEVGQYVGSRNNLILNLDGLAKNLKALGDGKVWIIGTAQQTLTEDDPRAALNSPELFKLKDRFPIEIDLESSDIKEICYRRLLGKSTAGQTELKVRFAESGPQLRHNTKLQDAKFYDADLNEETFVNLYPFLPAHFDILLHLLGALAKSTGGIGLRSAIKVIQDVLVDGPDDQNPVAENDVGWLATTVTLYDALEKDIRRAFQSVHKAVGKVLIRFPDSSLHQEIGKTVAVLQILGNMPVTAQNVASLMHPAIDAPSRLDAVKTAVEDLINDPIVPFGEKDGNLCFFSEKLNDIEQERAGMPLRTVETRRIQSEALKELFSPLPSTRLEGSFVVTTGVRLTTGSLVTSLAGERNPVQTVIEFVDPNEYETARARLTEESRQRSAQNTVFLLGRISQEAEQRVDAIYRCQEIAQRYRSDPDQEVRDYCTAQVDRAAVLAGELQSALRKSLLNGSFIFRADPESVSSLDDHDLLEASRKHLKDVALLVFERYSEAPIRAETALAEQFLKQGNLKAITAKLDPLGLVQVSGGTPRIRTDLKALVSIRDYIDRNGNVEGKRLITHFSAEPFGWSQDTLRYLIAAMLVAGDIKLKVSGREVTVNGQQAIEALRTNNAFKSIGVSLRYEKPPIEMLARAAERLTELIGDTVIPLEDAISKAATKHLPQFQHKLSPLSEKLDTLGLPGGDTVRSVTQEIADILLTDASDAPQRLGAEESALYNGLKWAMDVQQALSNGLEATIRDLQNHCHEIESLPESGVPGQLRSLVADTLKQVQERLQQDDFHKHGADLNTALTDVRNQTRNAAVELAETQQKSVRNAQQDLQRLSEWSELTQEEQSSCVSELEQLLGEATQDLAGIETLLNREYEITTRSAELKKHIEQLGQERRLERLEEEKQKAKKAGQKKLVRNLKFPSTVTNAEQLAELIRQLQELKSELTVYSEIEVNLTIADEMQGKS
jgi:hypothetical protein